MLIEAELFEWDGTRESGLEIIEEFEHCEDRAKLSFDIVPDGRLTIYHARTSH